MLPAGATVAGRDSHPLEDSAFSRRTEISGLGKAIGFQACMQSGMPKIIGMVLATAVLLFAIWVGPKIGMRLESEVLGHVGAAAIFLALAAALLWLGALQPRLI